MSRRAVGFVTPANFHNAPAESPAGAIRAGLSVAPKSGRLVQGPCLPEPPPVPSPPSESPAIAGCTATEAIVAAAPTTTKTNVIAVSMLFRLMIVPLLLACCLAQLREMAGRDNPAESDAHRSRMLKPLTKGWRELRETVYNSTRD